MSLESLIDEASNSQAASAEDISTRIRVIAGPGSGKSKVIEDRVKWLLDAGANPRRIVALSFTNASVNDLKGRIRNRCGNSEDVRAVRVSTLHSLALTLLKSEGQLERYPANPQVLGAWELEAIFDPEFGKQEHITLKSRQQQIRRYHEALWETGQGDHPNYRPDGDSVTAEESTKFNRFHNERTSVYACVLPGEIVAQCLSLIRNGLLNPKDSLNLEHLIVDEYQDLNPTDLAFVDHLAHEGVNVFVAGDDDQSIYSFRYASPLGIQKFADTYPDATHHELQHCFRCSPAVLQTAVSLITSTQSADRVPKTPIAVYGAAEPPITGAVHRWRFDDADVEALAIARSCGRLIEGGLSPNEILILLRSPRALAKPITEALAGMGLPFTSLNANKITDTPTGRAILSVLRIACEGEDPKDQDYVAHRTLLNVIPRVGVGTCNSISRKTVTHNFNYREIFYRPIPNGIFSVKETSTIERVSQVCQTIRTWNVDDTLEARMEALSETITSLLGSKDEDIWSTLIDTLPLHITLSEMRNYLGSDKEEAQQQILVQVRNRLREEEAEPEVITPKIRVLSMHGAKGLSAQVVFVPGLEDNVLPSAKSKISTGLMQEEARLLYVSITRARTACIFSYSRNRVINGRYTSVVAGGFNARLNGAFTQGPTSLDRDQVAEILGTASRLQ